MANFMGGFIVGLIATSAFWVACLKFLVDVEMEACCAGKETHTDI